MKEHISKYEFIKKEIEKQIENGIYKENARIPSENELCELYNSSRITVRRALDELVTRGVLYRQQGIGTFVNTEKKDSSHRETHKVLLVLPNFPELFSAGIVSKMMAGIQQVIEPTEYSLVTVMEPRNEEDAVKFIQNIKTISPKGIIYSFFYSDLLIDELHKLKLPLVFLDAEPQDNFFDVVTGEDFESSYRATSIAVMSGYTKIGFYSPWKEDFSTCSLRAKGIQKCLEENAIRWEKKQFVLRDIAPEFHEAVTKFDMVTDIKNYLLNNLELEVLIVMNDTVAFATYKAASELGVNISTDLKLISYGNYNWSSFPTIGLTTFEQNFKKYGREAAKILIQRMKESVPMIQQRKIIHYDLIRRSSF